jgi:hypothetical protein
VEKSKIQPPKKGDRLNKIKSGLIFGLVVFSMSLASVSTSQEFLTTEQPVIDPATPAVYDLGVCRTAEELDCIASVEIRPSAGTFQTAVSDRPQVWTVSEDRNGNQQYFGTKYWILTGTSSGVTQYFGVSARITTPQHTWDNGTKVSALRIRVDDLPVGNLAKVAIRTSWIRAQNLQFNAESANFTHSKIPGGNLWIFTGGHAKMSNYTSEEGWSSNWSNKADVDYLVLGFTIHHAGPDASTSWWDPRCASIGYTAQAFNGPGAGSPEWDNETQSLQFNIGAPHLDAQGNKNIGFFKLWVGESFANCQWPDNTLVDAEELVATVFNEDGSIQDADVTVTKNNGIIFLDAKNFHYSAPRFQITAKGTPIRQSSVPNNIRTTPPPTPSNNSAPSASPTTPNNPSPSASAEDPSSAPEENNAIAGPSMPNSAEPKIQAVQKQNEEINLSWVITAVSIILISGLGVVLFEAYRRKLHLEPIFEKFLASKARPKKTKPKQK